jgi:hypothetical protein
MQDATRRRQETACRIFGVEPQLDRVAVQPQLVLRERQRLATGDAQLPLDEVEAGDHLGHRMLDLQPGVHLHEIEPAVRRDDELDGARAHIADAQRGVDCGLSYGRAARLGHARCRRLLEDLLVAPLHGAIPLAEMDGVAMGVGEHLHLDVARAQDAALD